METLMANKYNLTSKQWALYNWLKKHAVGSENVKSGSLICEELGYSDKIHLRIDMRELRIKCNRKISSNNRGYYLPINKDDDSNFIVAKAFSHLYTVLVDGSLTKNQVYTFLNKLDISKPLDHQMQILFGEYQKDEIHVYSSDIYNPNRSVADEIEAIDDIRERFDKARSTYLAMGGYPIKLTTDEYISEIRKMESKKNERV